MNIPSRTGASCIFTGPSIGRAEGASYPTFTAPLRRAVKPAKAQRLRGLSGGLVGGFADRQRPSSTRMHRTGKTPLAMANCLRVIEGVGI
jgi:hypothetical protein